MQNWLSGWAPLDCNHTILLPSNDAGLHATPYMKQTIAVLNQDKTTTSNDADLHTPATPYMEQTIAVLNRA